MMDKPARFSDDPEKNELAEALLWLRNHYDVGKSECKNEVLRRVDEVLNRLQSAF